MENSSKTFTPEESLRLIEKYISNYRKNYRSDSFYFLLWGWVITIASLSHFTILRVLLSQAEYDLINMVSALNWSLFVIIGFVLQYYHISRMSGDQLKRSHLDKFISTLWQSAGGVILLVALISVKLGEYPTPFVLSVAGLATFITGRMIRFNPLKFGGIVFFIFAVVAAFVVNEYQLLVNAVAIFLGYIIPGYLLRNTKYVNHV